MPLTVPPGCSDTEDDASDAGPVGVATASAEPANASRPSAVSSPQLLPGRQTSRVLAGKAELRSSRAHLEAEVTESDDEVTLGGCGVL